MTILGAQFELTWPGIVVVLTALGLIWAAIAKVWRSDFGHRLGQAVFAPILYELRTNDGGSLKDHIMRRFDDVEDQLETGGNERAILRREAERTVERIHLLERSFDTDIARTGRASEGEIDDRHPETP